MKKTIIFITILTAFAGAGIWAAGWGSPSGQDISTVLETVKESPLSESEKEGILLMREEEKLARDVYLALYEKWGLRTFKNIADSESSHMDSMKVLIDRYNLSDPVKTDEEGVFTNPELQKLYNDLVAQGASSLEDALLIGATIEDLDIFDLERLIAETDNNDVKIVYQNLLKGSRNHMRSFAGQLSRSGAEYSATYISESDLARILNTEMERGAVITNPNFRF